MRRALVIPLVLLCVTPGPAVRAQEDEGPVVRATRLSPWVDARNPFRVRLRLHNTSARPLRDVRVQVAVHARVITRSELRAALDFGPSGPVVSSFEQAVRNIPSGESRVVLIRRRARALPATRGPYPVRITVAHAAGARTLSTVVPIFPPSEAGPLNVAWVLRLEPAAPFDAPEEISSEDLAALQLERLAAQMAVVAARGASPLTLAPRPAFVDALASLADAGVAEADDALTALRAAGSSVAEVATMPYAAANLPALDDEGPAGDVLDQITAGRATIERVLGRTTTLGAFVPPWLSVDGDTVATLGELGIRGTLVDPARLSVTPSEPAKLEPAKFGPLFPFPIGTISLPALLPDAAINDRLTTSTEGVLLGQAIVAESLGIWQELPLFARERVTLIAPAQIPNAAALAHALDGLAGAPWVRLLPASQGLRVSPTAGEPVPFAPRIPRDRPYLDAADDARASLALLSSITLSGIGTFDELERNVLLAESDEWLEDPVAGIALARRTVLAVEDIIDRLEVAARRVTLTSRTGDVPLTIINRNDFPLRARVRLSSPKIGFPSGEERELELAPGDNTIAIPVEARGTGSFPVEVALETPDGRRVLARETLVLRSTAVSAVSLAVVAGSGVFLLAAWVRRAIRRDRRSPRRPGRRGAR